MPGCLDEAERERVLVAGLGWEGRGALADDPGLKLFVVHVPSQPHTP